MPVPVGPQPSKDHQLDLESESMDSGLALEMPELAAGINPELLTDTIARVLVEMNVSDQDLTRFDKDGKCPLLATRPISGQLDLVWGECFGRTYSSNLTADLVGKLTIRDDKSGNALEIHFRREDPTDERIYALVVATESLVVDRYAESRADRWDYIRPIINCLLRYNLKFEVIDALELSAVATSQPEAGLRITQAAPSQETGTLRYLELEKLMHAKFCWEIHPPEASSDVQVNLSVTPAQPSVITVRGGEGNHMVLESTSLPINRQSIAALLGDLAADFPTIGTSGSIIISTSFDTVLAGAGFKVVPRRHN